LNGTHPINKPLLESRKSVRENELLSSSNSKQIFKIINDLEFSHSFIALNNFSIPGEKFGEPQKEIFALC
jgi:hypothetical protein